MKDLDEYLEKAAKQNEIVPLADIEEMLSSKAQHAQDRSHHESYPLVRRKAFVFSAVGVLVLLVGSIITLQVHPDKTRVDEEIFVPEAQRRVMRLVKNIAARRPNGEIAVSQFGSPAQPGASAIPIHLRSKFELSEDKLKLLGITFTDDFIKYEGNAKAKGYVSFRVPKGKAASFSQVDTHVLIGPRRAGIKEYAFYPWFLTDENGLQGPRYQFGGREPDGKMTNAFFLNAIDELIPVQVERPGFTKVIFWFSRTPELVSILESAAMISNKTEMLDDQPRTNTTNTLEIEIFPTITKAHVQVITKVLKEQKLEISLLTSSGEVLTIPVHNQVLAEGNHNFSMDLSNFRKGLYFVRIKSDPGRITIHRLFKE